MDGGGAAAVSVEKQGSEAAATATAAASYTYWVREMTHDAAPLPVPKKLSPQDSSNPAPTHLGSAWNRAGTWEEKNLNKWATDRIKELLQSVGSLEFSGGKAEIAEVTRCTGDAFLVTVRNKKRVGYSYELTVKVRGEWNVGVEKRKVKGHLDIPEFSFGELDDLQIAVRLSEEKDLPREAKQQIVKDLKSFLKPLREKLHQFEQELKDSMLGHKLEIFFAACNGTLSSAAIKILAMFSAVLFAGGTIFLINWCIGVFAGLGGIFTEVLVNDQSQLKRKTSPYIHNHVCLAESLQGWYRR